MQHELTVTKIFPVSYRVRLFCLEDPNGKALPDYDPGAHLDIEVPEYGKRAYSLIDFAPPSPRPTAYHLAVQREDTGAGGSLAMHQMTPGQSLSVSQPRNEFQLHRGLSPTLLLAGGIGLTPLISFASELSRRGHPFAFHYATRSIEHCVFRDRLESAFGDKIHFWHDDLKQIDLHGVIRDCAAGTQIYCCGPTSMMNAVRQISQIEGHNESNVHFEQFNAPEQQAGDRDFEIEIASTGQVFTVPKGRTILEVLTENAVDVVSDCARGDCGICQTDVVSGIPDHRDVVLSKAERASGKIMQICVSRAKSLRLVLDI